MKTQLLLQFSLLVSISLASILSSFNVSYCELQEGDYNCFDSKGNPGKINPTPENIDEAPTSYSCKKTDNEVACNGDVTWTQQIGYLHDCFFKNSVQYCFDKNGNPGIVSPVPDEGSDDIETRYEDCHNESWDDKVCYKTDNTSITWVRKLINLTDCHFDNAKYICTDDWDGRQGYILPVPDKGNATVGYKKCHTDDGITLHCTGLDGSRTHFYRDWNNGTATEEDTGVTGSSSSAVSASMNTKTASANSASRFVGEASTFGLLSIAILAGII